MKPNTNFSQFAAFEIATILTPITASENRKVKEPRSHDTDQGGKNKPLTKNIRQNTA
jgi:hypothetical protein